MRILKCAILSIFVFAGVLSVTFQNGVKSQETPTAGQHDDSVRQARFRHSGRMDVEDGRNPDAINNQGRDDPTEAPAGFDNLTNGFNEQGPPFDTINDENVVALRSFNDNRFIFEEFETIEDGLGPTYNAQSCRECHQNVVTGGASQIAEHRTGRTDGGIFFESLGGSLVQSRATHANIVERVAFGDDIRTFRISTNTLGDGFVEAIANETLMGIRDRQPQNMRGTALMVPVFEGNGNARLGRFGWKNQHASLESFSADAYLNEMGITSPFLPEENTSGGRDVSRYDTVADPEDDGVDLVAFANFIRSTKVPDRGPINATVRSGESLFRQVGCATCHTSSITTAPSGTVINGG
ncbi:MAG: hypothetical protein HOP17_03260, partial [Acidobacteria bacterium]|nr:hypothetical protein [Acidobacteriota bacterium]